MSNVDGKIQIDVEGDSASAQQAINAVVSKINEVVDKEETLYRALMDATRAGNLNEQQMQALKNACVGASAEVARLTNAEQTNATTAARAARATEEFKYKINDVGGSGHAALKPLGEKLEKIRGTMGAVSQLAGASTQQLGALGQVAQNVLMSFAGGGAAGAGFALLASAIGLAADKFDVFGTKASEAAKAAKDAIQKTRDEAIALIDALNQASGSASLFEAEALEKANEKLQKELQKAIPEGAESQFATYRSSASFLDDNQVVEAYRKAREIALQIEANEQHIYALRNDAAAREITAAEERLKSEMKAAEIKAEADKKRKESESKRLKEQGFQSEQEAIDAVKEIFAGRSGVSSLSGYAAPISGADANVMAGMATDAEMGLIEITEELTDAQQAQLDAMFGFTRQTEDFIMIDPLGHFVDQIAEAIDHFDLGDLATGIETVAKEGFEGAGAGIGAQVGAMVDTALGGASGGLGTVIGGILGGVLGKLLDNLVDALQIVTPIMDALAMVVAALTPIFQVVGYAAQIVGELILQLAPLILLLSRPIAALLIVVLRLVHVLLPLIVFVVQFVTALLQVLDFFTLLVGVIDQYFLAPLVNAVAMVFNAFVDMINGIILLLRQIPGLEEFGVLLEHMDQNYTSFVDDFAGSLDDLQDPVEQGTKDGVEEGLDSWGEQQVNLPSGYKYAANMWGSVDEDRGATMRGIVINIQNWRSSNDTKTDIEKLKRIALGGNAAQYIGSRRYFDDEKN